MSPSFPGSPRSHVVASITVVTKNLKKCEFSVSPDNKSSKSDDLEPVSSETAVRERAAQLIHAQREQILNRISALLVPEARKLTDTEDIMSTAVRRVDKLIARGLLRGQADPQIYALVHRVLERTIKEKARTAKRTRTREYIAAELRRHVQGNSMDVITSDVHERVGKIAVDPIDREIALLRGRGMRFHEIAASLGMSPAGVRKRWSRLKSRASEELFEQDNQ